MSTASIIESKLHNETLVTLHGDKEYLLIFETKKINSGQFKDTFVTTYRLQTPGGDTMESPYDNSPPEHWKKEDNPSLLNDSLQTIINNLVKLSGWKLEDKHVEDS